MGFYNPIDEKLEQIEDRLDDILLMLKDKQRTNPEQVFFDNQEFLQVMNISKRTAQYWRDSGQIGFCQIGQKSTTAYQTFSTYLIRTIKHQFNNVSIQNI